MQRTLMTRFIEKERPRIRGLFDTYLLTPICLSNQIGTCARRGAKQLGVATASIARPATSGYSVSKASLSAFEPTPQTRSGESSGSGVLSGSNSAGVTVAESDQKPGDSLSVARKPSSKVKEKAVARNSGLSHFTLHYSFRWLVESCQIWQQIRHYHGSIGAVNTDTMVSRKESENGLKLRWSAVTIVSMGLFGDKLVRDFSGTFQDFSHPPEKCENLKSGWCGSFWGHAEWLLCGGLQAFQPFQAFHTIHTFRLFRGYAQARARGYARTRGAETGEKLQLSGVKTLDQQTR